MSADEARKQPHTGRLLGFTQEHRAAMPARELLPQLNELSWRRYDHLKHSCEFRLDRFRLRRSVSQFQS
jgi:hypothetical protein